MITTIEEAKDFLRKNWEKGVRCPCCHQFVKKYKRKLTSGMAIGIINLYIESGKNTETAIHISKLQPINGGEFAQLEKWELISSEQQTSGEKRTSGKWRITQKGIEFVEGKIRVPASVYTYNMKTLSFEESKTTSIKEALGKKFNYDEIMSKA